MSVVTPRARHPAASTLAQLCPVVEDDKSEWSSLRDIVITGTETPYLHFIVEDYRPDAYGGAGDPWGTIHPLNGPAGEGGIIVALDALSVRRGLEAYISDRLERGWSVTDLVNTLLCHVTDADIADSILQFIVYGEERFS